MRALVLVRSWDEPARETWNSIETGLHSDLVLIVGQVQPDVALPSAAAVCVIDGLAARQSVRSRVRALRDLRHLARGLAPDEVQRAGHWPRLLGQLVDRCSRSQGSPAPQSPPVRRTDRSNPGNAAEVTVVIPTHDRPGFLAEATQSVAAQVQPPSEVIVVHDGDVPPPSNRPPSPAVHVQACRPGASGARNTGLALATGELIAFLDDDDLWDPRFLAMAAELIARSGADFVVSWSATVNEGRTGPGGCMLEGLRPQDVVAVNPGFTGSNVLYRTDSLRSLGGFDEGLRVSNDKDLLVRLLTSGATYRVLPRRLVTRYVGHAERLGSANPQRRLEALRRYRAKHDGLLSRRQRRYLKGREARLTRRMPTSRLRRWARTATMLWLLGPQGVRQTNTPDASVRAHLLRRSFESRWHTAPAATAIPGASDEA